MSFELRVEFSGLIMYLRDPKRPEVMLVMPDARRYSNLNATHDDGTPGIPHAGYVRWDLAGLVNGVPAGDALNGPRYEVVHRFNHEFLDFNLPVSSMDDLRLDIPNFGRFAPTLVPIDGVMNPTPSTDVLMRTMISGGTLKAIGQGKRWTLPSTFQPKAKADETYSGVFTGFALWSRTIDADSLTITISSFDRSYAMPVQLRPVLTPTGYAITLKVANLCADNPLEWEEFGFRQVFDSDDDFKWLYSLLKPKAKDQTLKSMLAKNKLPCPQLDHSAPGPLGHENCMGGELEVDFPDGV